MRVPLSKPDIGESEINNVVDVLRSGRLSLGPKVEEFEKSFAAYVGTKYAIATNSGTSALHLAIRALGIGPEDEILTTSFSFVASTNCILYEGAHPVFIDIDPATLNIDVVQLRRFLLESCVFDSQIGLLLNKATGRAIRAILPVHVFGMPCDMTAIRELANQYRLNIIEDACEALGAEHQGRRVGTFGDAAVFAFYPNKQITTGEGGMLVTNDEKIANECRSLRNQGRESNSAWLSHARLGYNYRLSELHSALGLAQLARVNELLKKRERVAAAYKSALSEVRQLILPEEFEGNKRSWFVFVVQLDVPEPRALRDRTILRLRELGVDSQAYFPAIHRQPYMALELVPAIAPLTNTELAADRSLALPFFPSMASEEITFVVETLKRILDEEIATSNSDQVKSATAGDR
jgi:perosamine synthetase